MRFGPSTLSAWAKTRLEFQGKGSLRHIVFAGPALKSVNVDGVDDGTLIQDDVTITNNGTPLLLTMPLVTTNGTPPLLTMPLVTANGTPPARAMPLGTADVTPSFPQSSSPSTPHPLQA